jgi:PAS domain S-box-containing protein
MDASKSMTNERVGLAMIASSLTVILVITVLLVMSQIDVRREQARVRGVSLVELLSRIQFDELIPGKGREGPLQVVRHTQSNPDFAYAVVVDPEGSPLARVTAPGVIVPRASMGTEPASWRGDRVFAAEDEQRTVREFFGPVLSEGRVVAHVRIGFFEPGFGIIFEQTPFFALLALPIFLLTPLSYVLLRYEFRPLAEANKQISTLLDGQAGSPMQAGTSGQVGAFVHSFNQFVELTQERLENAQTKHTGMLASSKVVSYQKARIESILETLPDAAMVLDETGTVTFANAKVETLIGVAQDEVLGRKPPEWCDKPALLEFLAQYHGTTARLHRAESMQFRPDASSAKQIEVGAYPLVRARSGPEFLGTLMLFRDVTSAMLRKQRQVEFVSHVAHELKSPLNTLALYTETLVGKEGESEEFRVEACSVIQDEVERLSDMIGTLLSIARIESGQVSLERQRVRPNEFMTDTLEAASRSRASKLTFRLEAPQELSPIFVDKGLMRVVLNNLLTNAIKYNREDGEVVLSAEENADAFVFRVRDTGLGIAAADKERIFQKFFRSDAPSISAIEGHGLGLTLAKQIVELHGGEIEVETTPGEGSEFSVALPNTPALLTERVAG